MPIDPTSLTSGAEWQIGALEPPTGPAAAGSGTGSVAGGFGGMLKSLTDSQEQAASAAQALATGQSADPTTVVMAVERAQLAMQLAGQIRTKAVEAAQDIFHTQV